MYIGIIKNNMKKFSAFLRSMVSITTVLVLVFILTGSANAASTIGTNMLTTGTFTQTVGSATAAQFQNAAGTINTLTVDTTNNRVGVNTTTPQTKFEVQGTASASYFITGNTLQVGGFATAAYSRFGTSTSGRLKNANDLLVSGQFEVAGSAQFVTASISGAFDVGGTASISGVLTLGNGQIRPQDNSATAFRFQNAAGTTTVMTINTTLGRVGIGATPQTVFEVQGTASASYLLTGNTLQVGGFATAAYSRFGTSTSTRLVGANDLLVSGQFGVAGSAQFVTASTSGAFESIGRASASTMFVTSSFVAGHNVASSAAEYVAEFGGRETATVSILFGSSAAGSATGAGTCLQMKNTAGTWVYLRINGTSSLSLDIDTTKCH
ncbi:MAG: hypothetical protein A2750_01685 [Candidatus Yanofskybacteria bacterium RIFCSPHIGHO2_01_FULL_45_42]|uniref:Uncharacterized protein n=1 Tax=Candidatus Yanofskybacteria bacterium RIFCSPHIGHO2_01_FULL_45_42 TaxID=1802671 RepID=A0A1F8F6T2_9BACT|nr:MAG: hypothetical protein A2750_01685 [Candidatus Yanofskybacteria bacterium RIFCSPHIGHO2_01_FULL_45_42]